MEEYAYNPEEIYKSIQPKSTKTNQTSLSKRQNRAKGTICNLQTISSGHNKRFPGTSLHFKALTQSTFPKNIKEFVLYENNNKNINSLSTTTPSQIIQKKEIKSRKYPFLSQKINRYKFLQKDNLDYILTTPEITESSINYSLATVQQRKAQTPLMIKHMKTEDNIANEIKHSKIIKPFKNKLLSKLLTANLKKEDQNNYFIKKNLKKYSMTARLFLQVQSPYDIVEEHLTDVDPENKYKRFKLMLQRQQVKNQKLKDDVQRAAAANEQDIKVYVSKLLINQIKQDFHRKHIKNCIHNITNKIDYKINKFNN